MSRRVAIIGNSGSGKSHLARLMAADLGAPAIDLDDIFWLPGGFTAKRSAQDVDRVIGEAHAHPAWVVEGVFGELVGRFLDEADELIWLDMPWDVCREGVLARERTTPELVEWAGKYWTRTDLRSHAGHQRMFDEFPRDKRRFTVRDEVDEFMGVAI